MNTGTRIEKSMPASNGCTFIPFTQIKERELSRTHTYRTEFNVIKKRAIDEAVMAKETSLSEAEIFKRKGDRAISQTLIVQFHPSHVALSPSLFASCSSLLKSLCYLLPGPHCHGSPVYPPHACVAPAGAVPGLGAGEAAGKRLSS